MEVFKIAVCGVICALTAVTVREHKPETAPLVTVAAGIVLLSYMLGDIEKIISEFNSSLDCCGINPDYFYTVLKLTLIAYVTKFAAEVCRDCHENSIAAKAELAGKIAVLTVTVPVICDFFNLVNEMLAAF